MKAASNTKPTPNQPRARVVLTDHQGSVRELLRGFLARRSDCELVGEGRTAAEALSLCRELRPEVLLTEVLSGEPDTPAVLAALRAEDLPTRTLVYTSCANEFALLAVLRTHPHAMVHKDESFPALVSAFELMLRGGSVITPSIRALLDRVAADSSAGDFTERELEVWKLTAEGHSNKKIADQLHLSPKTTEHYRSVVMEKLGVHDIASLTRAAVRRGLTQ